jgi:hypothetical protein
MLGGSVCAASGGVGESEISVIGERVEHVCITSGVFGSGASEGELRQSV